MLTIVETLQTPQGPAHQLRTTFSCEYHFTYDAAGRLRTRVETYPHQTKPLATESFDLQGHRTSMIMPAFNGKKMTTTCNSATYDASGALTRFEVIDNDEFPISVPVKTSSDATGTTSTWSANEPHRRDVCTVKYDPAGRLIEKRTEMSGGAFPLVTTIAYNDSGDVSATTTNFGHSETQIHLRI